MSHNRPNWLARFHAGDRSTLAAVYLEHLSTVERVVAQYLVDADRENVIHEVFYKLVARPESRRSFKGGNLAAWLTTVARNQAIDYARRHHREIPTDPWAVGGLAGSTRDAELEAECRHMVDVFRRCHLPAKWVRVFDTRWLRGLSQREAARELGLRRTTLAYQELRIRGLLRRYLLEGKDDGSDE